MSKRRFALKKIPTKRQLRLYRLGIVTVRPRNVYADSRKELHFCTHCAVSEFIIRYIRIQ